MALTETQVVANELERVRDKVPVLFERDDKFYSQIEKRNVEVISARDMRVPLELRPGGRFGQFDPDGGDLGRGDGPTFDKAVVSTYSFKHAIEWTKKAEWATDNSRKAVLNTLKHLLKTSMLEFRRQVESQCMTGGDGVLGVVSAVSTSGGKDTLTLDASGDGFNAKLLRYGQFVNVYDTTLGTRRTLTGGAVVNGEAQIDLFDLVNKKIRINGTCSAPIVAGDKVVISGVTATPPTSLQGVPYHHSNATTGYWLGFDRSTTPEVVANAVNASSGALALPYPRLALNKAGDRVGIDEGMKCMAWMHPCQVQAYEELGQLVTLINKQNKDEGLNLYFGDGMQMAGVPVKPSFVWDKTRIDFIFNQVWGRAEMHPASFYEVDGRKIFEIRSTTTGGVVTSQVFYITVSFNTFVDNPAICTYIYGLAKPSGY